MTSEAIEDHISTPLISKSTELFEFLFVIESHQNYKWMLILWRHKVFIKWSMYSKATFVLFSYFCFRPSDLIITMTYVIIDNFCPCFIGDYNKGLWRLWILNEKVSSPS